MIKLEVEEYCDDCPEFDAHIEKAVLFDGYSKEYCNTNIVTQILHASIKTNVNV